MARTNDLPRVLWLVASSWLIGCGRVGFGELERDAAGALADAPAPADAANTVDGPVIPAPVGPKLNVGTIPTMTSTCGSAPAPVSFKLSNPGDAELTITNLTSDVEGFHLTQAGSEIALPIRIAAGAAVTFEARPPMAVIGTDVGGSKKRAVATIESDAAGQPTTTFDLVSAVVGANVVVTVPAAPAPLAFSGTSGLCPQPRAATIRNSGTAATVQIRLPAEFLMTGAPSASVAQNGVMTRSFRPFSNGPCSGDAVITYEVTGPNCGTSGATALNASFDISGTSTCFCS